MYYKKINIQLPLLLIGALLFSSSLFAQTDADKEKLSKDTFGAGTEFQYSAFTGNHASRADLYTESFDAWPLAGWTIIDNAGQGLEWADMATHGMSNNTNGSGDAASCDSDNAGAVDFDTELISPSIDCSAATNVVLDFAAYYENFANRDFFEVDVSVDGGSTWTNVLSWNEDHGTEDVNLDISGIADGQADVSVRFHYYDLIENWDWQAQVDDFVLSADNGGGPATSEVPTLSTYGLIVFISLAAFAAIIIRRRQLS